MNKQLFLALSTAVLILSKLPVNGHTGNNQSMNCNPIIIYTRLNINDVCGLQGEIIEVNLEITELSYNEVAFAIAYNPEVITPFSFISFYDYGNFDLYFDYTFPEPGIIDFYINPNGFFCGGMALINFSTDTIGYSKLEFIDSVTYPNGLWWAKLNDGSITVSNPNAQVVHLNQGWNGISSFLEPDQISVDQLFSPLGNDLEFLFCDEWQYHLEFSGWPIPVWDISQGYFIKVSNETNFIFTGTLPQSNDIQLDEGWNLMPVTSCHSIPPATYFGDNIGQVEIIKEAAGEEVLWPEKQVNNLSHMQPGKSYLVKMTESCTISPPQ
jgi:hypothetical protein